MDSADTKPTLACDNQEPLHTSCFEGNDFRNFPEIKNGTSSNSL